MASKINAESQRNRAQTARRKRLQNQAQCYGELLRLLREDPFREDLLSALLQPLELIVLGTMSSGKSTLLNAFMHQPLLPARNMACTTHVFRIEDNDGISGFQARRGVNADDNGWTEASTALLDSWNIESECTTIDIVGNFPTIKNVGGKLVLYDTPGPNNARNEAHREITLNLLRDGRYDHVLYVLDATTPATDDERRLLEFLLESQNSVQNRGRKQVIFALGKADRIDEEGGESIIGIVANTTMYLTKIGFKNPLIVPVSSHAALLMRMTVRGLPLTRCQQASLDAYLGVFSKNPLWLATAASVHSSIKKKLRRTLANINSDTDSSDFTVLNQLVYATGLPTIEMLLESHLVDFILPHSLKSANEMLKRYNSVRLIRWISSSSR